MTLQLLPVAEWAVEPVLVDGAPNGEVIVGAWVRDGVREFVKLTPPSGPIVRPPGVLTYAKAGGPPHDWYGLAAVDVATGLEVENLVEVDTVAGWIVRHRLNAEQRPYAIGGSIALERVFGAFEIRRPA